VAVAACALAVACVDAEVTRIGLARPARPQGCAVELFPDGRPAFAVTDVATADVSCSGDRKKCVDELRKVACQVGADTAYGFAETHEAGFTHLVARLAARN
jgi:hypothetical protein